MKIYIVTSSSYSDYCIEAVFTDEKEAAKYIATRNSTNGWQDDYKIEEYETQDGRIDVEDNIAGYEYKGAINKNYFFEGDKFIVFNQPRIVFKPDAIDSWTHVWLEEENYELAKRILQDRYAQRKALKEGI